MIVYLVYNLKTDKAYVGQTTYTLDKRWRDHISAAKTGEKSALYNAMRKYGLDSFEVQQIGNSRNKESLSNLEKICIVLFRTNAHDYPKTGYNLTLGGDGVTHTEEFKKKLAEANRSRIWTDESRKKIGVFSHNRKKSESELKKLSEAFSGSKNPMFGRPSPSKGKPAWNRGIPHSEEIKDKLKLAKKNSPLTLIYAQKARDAKFLKTVAWG